MQKQQISCDRPYDLPMILPHFSYIIYDITHHDYNDTKSIWFRIDTIVSIVGMKRESEKAFNTKLLFTDYRIHFILLDVYNRHGTPIKF